MTTYRFISAEESRLTDISLCETFNIQFNEGTYEDMYVPKYNPRFPVGGMGGDARRGIKLSPEELAKHSKAMMGHVVTDQARKNMSLAKLGKRSHMCDIMRICPHCGKSYQAGAYARWHGDNCKLKKEL